MTEKYINFGNSKHGKHGKGGKRRVRTGAVLAAVLFTVGVIFAAVYAFSRNDSKTVPASSSSAVSAAANNTKNSTVSPPAKASSVPTSSVAPSGKTTKRIPVLMYHSITFDPKQPNNILRVPKEKFEAQMKWLHDNGYNTLSLDELYTAVSENKPVPEKTVVITFDDGYVDNYVNALPIIKQYGLKATTFMITSKIGVAQEGYLTADQIKEMDQNGIRVECHTVTHPDLSKLSESKQTAELTQSKAALESLLGRKVNFIAYPSGKYNSTTIAVAKKAGYELCFKMNGGVATIGSDRYEFPRAFMGDKLQDFIEKVQG